MGVESHYTIPGKYVNYDFVRYKNCSLCGEKIMTVTGNFKYCSRCKETEEFKDKTRKYHTEYNKKWKAAKRKKAKELNGNR